MRGPKPAYPITLTAEEAKQLQQLIRAHSTPHTLDIVRPHDRNPLNHAHRV
jgi:hypothetical protein